MGSGCGALNCLANAVRVFACITSPHFAVEKATKQRISHNMMVLYVLSIQFGEILRLPLIYRSHAGSKHFIMSTEFDEANTSGITKIASNNFFGVFRTKQLDLEKSLFCNLVFKLFLKLNL